MATPCPQQTIYWSEAGALKIRASGVGDVSVIDIMTSGLSQPLGIAVDVVAEKVYYVDYGNNNIKRVNLDGSNEETLVTGLNNPRCIAIDNDGDKIYWTDDGNNLVQRATLAGSGIENIASGTNAFGLALNVPAGKVYWTEASATGSLVRANLDGSNQEFLISGSLSYPRPIDIDIGNGYLYFTNYYGPPHNTSALLRTDLEGSGLTTIVASGTYLWSTYGIAIDSDNGHIYYADYHNSRDDISRTNLLGSGFEVVISGLNNPRGVDVITGPGTTIDLFLTGSSAVPASSGTPLRVIHRLTKTQDYNPQLMGTFQIPPATVNIQVWDVGDGQNTEVPITTSGCYQIGDTNKWAWSTQYLPFLGYNKKYHHYFRMTSNEGEMQHGEFLITVPERGRWSYPDRGKAWV